MDLTPTVGRSGYSGCGGQTEVLQWKWSLQLLQPCLQHRQGVELWCRGQSLQTDLKISAKLQNPWSKKYRDVRVEPYPGKALSTEQGCFRNLSFWKEPPCPKGHVPRLARGRFTGGWGCPPSPRCSPSALPLPEKLSLPSGLLVGLDPKSTEFMERFLLRSTALIWVNCMEAVLNFRGSEWGPEPPSGVREVT